MSALTLIFLWCGIAVSNFLYQQMNGKSWETAIERSYFQALPLVLVWLSIAFGGEK